MIVELVSASGTHEVHADLVPGSPDSLAVVRKWRDDPNAFSVVAQIPGREAWFAVATQGELDRPGFPHGKVREALENMISGLAGRCEEYARERSSRMLPADLALSRYLGILTDDQVAAHRSLVEGERASERASKELEEQQLATARESRVDQALLDFKAGEMIPAEEFEALLNRFGIRLTPSTRGSMRKKLVSAGREGVRHRFDKLPDGIFRALVELKNRTASS